MSAQRGIRYIPAIDGLRAVAVIAVMLWIRNHTFALGFNSTKRWIRSTCVL